MNNSSYVHVDVHVFFLSHEKEACVFKKAKNVLICNT